MCAACDQMAAQADNEAESERPFRPNARLDRSDLEYLGDWLAKHGNLGMKLTHGYTLGALVDDLAAIGAGIHNERVDLGLVGEDGEDICVRCGGEKFIDGKEGRDGSYTTSRPCPDCNR